METFTSCESTVGISIGDSLEAALGSSWCMYTYREREKDKGVICVVGPFCPAPAV